MDHGDIGEGISPEWMGVVNVDSALGGHANVTDAVGAPHLTQRVDAVHRDGCAHVFNDLRGFAYAVEGHALRVQYSFR